MFFRSSQKNLNFKCSSGATKAKLESVDRLWCRHSYHNSFHKIVRKISEENLFESSTFFNIFSKKRHRWTWTQQELSLVKLS